MDIFDIRHRNLLLLIQQLADRGIRKNADVSQALGGLGSSYLSQLKSGKKIGEETARKIEAGIMRASGWMDFPQWEQASGVEEPKAAYEVPTLSAQEWALLENYRAADLRGKRMIDVVAAAAVMAVPNGR
jgi:hypothetical protein